MFASFLNSFQIDNKLNLQFERGYQSHTSDFRTIDSTPTCCFNINNGTSLSNGLLLNYRFKVFKKLYLGIGFDYRRLKGKMNSFLEEEISIEGINYLGRFEYAVEHKTDMLFLNLGIDYNVYKDLYFGFNFGTNSIINLNYYQYEKLISPSDRGYFLQEDGVRTRRNNEFRGDIKTSALNYNIEAKVFYELPINKKKTLNITPTIGYNLFIGELIENTNWSFNSVNLTMGINYYFHKDTSNYEVDKNIDKTLLIAPVIITKGREVFRNELEYEVINYNVEIIDIGLTEKIKKIEIKKKTPLDDTLRLFYKFGKFNNIQNLELEINYDKSQTTRNLDLLSDKIDFKIDDLLDYYEDKVTYNLKLIDKQKVYSKGNYTFEEKVYYSNNIVINQKKSFDKNYNIKLIKWRGETEKNRIFELIKSNVNDINKIESIQSNSEYGLKLIQESDNPRISYNDNDELVKVLKSFIGIDYYIILNEN